MSPRICICCGEPMGEDGNALSRNPNLCASCSSLADGMLEDGCGRDEETFAADSPSPAPEPLPPAASEPEPVVLRWTAQKG